MRVFAAGVWAATLWAAPVLAQDPKAEDDLAVQGDDPRIIVEAPLTERERRAQLREMVTDIINKPRDGRTVATYFQAVCPRVIGLPEAETRVIEERIRENADTLGVNRRRPGKDCDPNVTVVFVPPSKGPPEAWMTSENDMLQHLLSYQRNTILNEHDPVRAWTFNEVRSADGAPLPNPNGQRISGAQSFANPVRLLSRLRTNSTVEIKGSAVMIELTSAMNKTLGQLADYASMRTFGNSRSLAPDAAPAADTILTLFRDENPPEGLTTFDRALISKLYATSRNSLARRYYNNIASRAFEMEKEETAQAP
ncbi:MAG: hypothetical protein AAGA34_14605 [Pseudomonadota bacterium]